MSRDATTEQVAAALHVKPATVRKYAREHRLPYDTTPGGHRRYDVEEAVRAIRGGDVEPQGGGELAFLDAGPYVRVAPSASVVVLSVPANAGRAPVVAYDTAEDAEVWGQDMPVV